MSDDNSTLPYPRPSTEHPTLVIPRDSEAAPARRRRWPWVVLVLIVILAGLAVAGEFLARAVLPGIVRTAVIEQLDLPTDQQLDVEASGLLLPQLLIGRLDELRLSTDQVTMGGVTGAVDVTAIGVPLRGGDLTRANGTVRIDQDQFSGLLAASDLPIESVTLEAPNATVSGSIEFFGIPIPITLTIAPGVESGDLLLTPLSLVVGGVTLDADDVAARFGSLGAQFTEPQRLCIADQLPAGLTVTGIAIDGTAVVVDVDVNGAIVSDETLQENGTCR